VDNGTGRKSRYVLAQRDNKLLEADRICLRGPRLGSRFESAGFLILSISQGDRRGTSHDDRLRMAGELRRIRFPAQLR
jgi:hypothetical protein